MEQRHDSRIEHFRELGKEVEYLGLKDRDLLDQKGQLDDQIRTDHKRLKKCSR
ncbi:hypothetical protein [Limosilactobacillus sp.]|uniref:hypothetical protein n=1 Tax=Limosilactobacillus sp. TaxID=2773925 RepID=UPI003F0C4417